MDSYQSWYEDVLHPIPKVLTTYDCTHRVLIADTAPLERGSIGFYVKIDTEVITDPKRKEDCEVHDLIVNEFPDKMKDRFRGFAGIISDTECTDNRHLYKKLNDAVDPKKMCRFASISQHAKFIIVLNHTDRYYRHIINPEEAASKKYLLYRFSNYKNRFQLEFSNLRVYLKNCVGIVAIVRLVEDEYVLLESV